MPRRATIALRRPNAARLRAAFIHWRQTTQNDGTLGRKVRRALHRIP